MGLRRLSGVIYLPDGTWVMIKLAGKAALIAALCLVCLLLGKSRAETKIVTKQIEVVKYVEKKKAEIYSAPNAQRDDLVRLFNTGKL